MAIEDQRPKMIRLLDKIMDTPQVQVDAFNLGMLYSTSADNAIPHYATTDTSSEADRFWEGVEAGTKRVKALTDALGDDERSTDRGRTR